MKYISVKQASDKWNISERSVRGYCAEGKIEGAVLVGKIWGIPENAEKPGRKKRVQKGKRTVLSVLKEEQQTHVTGGLYHKVQIELTYNSNHMEGSRLTQDQTRYIFETNSIGFEGENIRIDDIVETANHFRCIDYMIENVNQPLSESFIKRLHFMLKNGTTDSRKSWFVVGDYKSEPNEVGGKGTTEPEQVEAEVKTLLEWYKGKEVLGLDDLLEFHYRFERIHPFQDGNGRVGRLLLFKECLRNNIVPFIIEEDLKLFYYRGLNEWENEKGFLRDTCLSAQDKFKTYLDYFRIEYTE